MTQPKQNRKAVHRLAHWTGLSYAQCNSLIYHMTSDSPFNGSTYGEKVVDHIFETAAKENPQLFCPFFKFPKMPPEVTPTGIYDSYRKHIESLMMTTKADTKDKVQISPAMAEVMLASGVLTLEGRVWVNDHTAKDDPEVITKGVTKETTYKARGRTFKKLSDAALFEDIMRKLEKNSEVMTAVRLEFEKRFWPNRRYI